MTQPFHWPSAADRAENSELNRVCEYAEQLEAKLRGLGEAAPTKAEHPVTPDQATPANRETNLSTLVNLIEALEPHTNDFGVDCQDEMFTYNCLYCDFSVSNIDNPDITHDENCPVNRLRAFLKQIPESGQSFQQRVAPWMQECFGPRISADTTERNHRFLEEALELVQAMGCTKGEAQQLVDYVYGRPVGDPPQEVGGVRVTLAALCLAAGLDEDQCAETELVRIWAKVPEIREKQKTKPHTGPLPGVYPDRPDKES